MYTRSLCGYSFSVLPLSPTYLHHAVMAPCNDASQADQLAESDKVFRASIAPGAGHRSVFCVFLIRVPPYSLG